MASKSSCDSFRSKQEKNFVDAKKFGSSAAELQPHTAFSRQQRAFPGVMITPIASWVLLHLLAGLAKEPMLVPESSRRTPNCLATSAAPCAALPLTLNEEGRSHECFASSGSSPGKLTGQFWL